MSASESAPDAIALARIAGLAVTPHTPRATSRDSSPSLIICRLRSSSQQLWPQAASFFRALSPVDAGLSGLRRLLRGLVASTPSPISAGSYCSGILYLPCRPSASRHLTTSPDRIDALLCSLNQWAAM